MELNWSTFFLEILNFIVLVWLLKHFFYRPVLAVIERRRAAIEKTLGDAKARESEAAKLKDRYEAREAQWQQEREAARSRLAEEIAAERERSMTALRTSIDEERKKAKAQDAKRQEAWRRSAEEQAITLGATFTSRLLSRLASPALQTKLLEVTFEDLHDLAREQTDAIAASAGEGAPRAKVSSAFPLDDHGREQLRKSLARLAGRAVEADFTEDRTLLAGIRVSLGAWVLHANLRDELEFFTENA